MSNRFTEQKFEEWIDASLLRQGYREGFVHSGANESRFDKEFCLIPEDVIGFIKATQPKAYERLEGQLGEGTDRMLLKTIDKFIAKRGIVDTLRKGVETRGCGFDLAYFKPKSTLNAEHQARYEQNRFVAVRQLHYSTRNRNSIDMVLFLNGIPLVTMELKNQLTGQNFKHSEHQYKHDRDPAEPLLSFKRCLVHFCVDNDRVSMTTELRKGKTRFLPYNKGIENPVVADDYRSSYLWKEILTPDSLLDIVEHFAFVSTEKSKVWNGQTQAIQEVTSSVQIFPRYHQLEVIRKLRSAVKVEGAGHNYLIQHTTGSGKSYSIGWLAHALAALYAKEGDTRRLFDSILVITDRKVLDQQLQETVKRLEQTRGVVHKVDKDSAQLRTYLEAGKDIIITTIQKFPHVSKVISELKGMTFAVIIDEVHSSQTGETSKHLKKSLTTGAGSSDEDDETTLEDLVQAELEARGPQEHLSFFGFTGTPKNKTLELFGRRNADGQFVPFHTYTMEQSIHEEFTLDVLKNYTTLSRYFKVLNKAEGDQEVPESKARRQLVDYVDSHPKRIAMVVKLILDHFVDNGSKEIGGVARGMVVVRSRKHCVLFHEEMVREMRARGLAYSCLVAFSGTIHHHGEEVTEESLNKANGLESKDIPGGLKSPAFRLLIVSNKFQTGFDEPMLQSMYIDKKLSGVQCVQTLSRLNRTMRGKERTFILDFANQTEDIVAAFQPYFTTTVLEQETDPDKLVDLLWDIKEYNLYTAATLDAFCTIFFDRSKSEQLVQPILNEVVALYLERLNADEQQDFKSLIQSFVRLYSYIAQITPVVNPEWEKSFAFLSALNKKLPRRGEEHRLDLSDAIDLESLRIAVTSETSMTLASEPGQLFGLSASGGKAVEEERVLLSEIIEELNTRFGLDFGDQDRVRMDLMNSSALKDADIGAVLTGNNSYDTKREYFREVFKKIIIDHTSDSFSLYRKMTADQVYPLIADAAFEVAMSHFAGRGGLA